MEVIIGQIFRCLVSLLLLQLADSNSNTGNICHEWNVTSNQTNINMNTSLIAGSNKSCSCRISYDLPTSISIVFKNVTSPNCTTTIEPSVDFVIFKCENDSYNSFNSSLQYLTTIDEIWLTVTSNNNTEEPMIGSIKIQGLSVPEKTEFTLECFKPNTNSSSTTTLATTETSTMTSSTRASSTQVHSSTTVESTDTMPASELKGHGNKNLPVPLIAGCASGGFILLIVLVILAVACHRRKKPHRGMNNNRTKDSDDEYLSMENDLYVTSADLNRAPYPHQSTLRHSSNVGIYDNMKDYITPERYSSQGYFPADGMKTGYLQAPNGDLYALVHKP